MTDTQGPRLGSSTTGDLPPTAAERERFATLLREAVGSGVLSLEEFEHRLDAVYSAASLAQLEELVRWLPPPPVPARSAGRKNYRRSGRVVAGLLLLLLVVAMVRVFDRGPGTRAQQQPLIPASLEGSTIPDAATMLPTATTYVATSDVVPPAVRAVLQVSPLNDGKQYAKVFVDWPAGTRIGCVATVAYYQCGPPVDSITFTTETTQPLSYKAVACFVDQGCTPDATDYAGSNMAVGPWFRPRLDASALTATPAAPDVTKDPSISIYHLRVRLSEQPNAPAFAVYRNGVLLVVLYTSPAREQCQPGILCLDDSAMGVTGPTVSYAVSACYSDCYTTDILNGFAQATAAGPSIAVLTAAGK